MTTALAPEKEITTFTIDDMLSAPLDVIGSMRRDITDAKNYFFPSEDAYHSGPSNPIGWDSLKEAVQPAIAQARSIANYLRSAGDTIYQSLRGDTVIAMPSHDNIGRMYDALQQPKEYI